MGTGLTNNFYELKQTNKMKVEIKENGKVKEREFPKLMVYDEVIVLMLSESEGVRVDGKFILYSNEWAMRKFTDFEGSITLTND